MGIVAWGSFLVNHGEILAEWDDGQNGGLKLKTRKHGHRIALVPW